jgi:soluble lytic murein transglycosylase-like protein
MKLTEVIQALPRSAAVFIFAMLFSHAAAAQQSNPLSPPEHSPIPLTDADQERARINAASKSGSPAVKQISKDDKLILIPARHLSTGNKAIDELVHQAADRYKLDPCLIVSVMGAESAFNHRAVSPRGASGLMQLMPATAVRFGVKDIFDPGENVMAGASYLRWLLDRFGGDVRLALAGYNAGEGAVELYGNRIPPFLETQNYVRLIYSNYSRAHGESGAPNEQGQLTVSNSAQAQPAEKIPTYNQIIRFTSVNADGDLASSGKSPDKR